MEAAGSQVSLEELLSHARWVQRLARQLIREDAEDLVQDVWLRATLRPPRAFGSPRPWLASMLRNRARNQARDDQRRRARDEASSDPSASPPTPQELTERMEVQRLLAELVASLPQEYRQVVHLRYVEELEPTDIARLLQQPAGTIRWRLHEALSRLRDGMDRRLGGRRAWILALAPIAGWPADSAEAAEVTPTTDGEAVRTTVAVARRGRGVLPSGLFLAAFGLAVCLIVAVAWRLRDPDRKTQSGGSDHPPAGQHGRGRPPGPGVPRLAGLGGAATAESSCPEVEPMRAYLAELKTAGDLWRNPREVFADSAPNPALEAALRPLMETFLVKLPARCDLSLTCRGQVCEMAILSPDGIKPWDCHPRPGPEFRDCLTPGLNNLVDSGTPYHDPVKGKSFTRMSQLWRFARQDGAPLPHQKSDTDPELKFDFGRLPPTPPRDLSGACRDRWTRLDREQSELRRSLTEIQPQAAFVTSASNPELADRARAWIRKTLNRPTDSLPLSVECRGQVCMLTPSEGLDPLAIKWHCREAPAAWPAVCVPSSGSGDWYDLVSNAQDQFGWFRPPPIRDPATGKVKPAFLVARAGEKQASPWLPTLAFMDSFDWRGATRSCEALFPDRGMIEFRLDLPRTAADENPPNRILLHVGGPLGGTRLARCIAEAFETASGRFTVPASEKGSVMYFQVSFPLDATALEKKLHSLREWAKAQPSP